MAIHIDERVCKGCALCVHFCKEGVLRLSERRNWKGFRVAEAAAPEKCTACRLCETACPDFAICIEREKKKGSVTPPPTPTPPTHNEESHP